MPYSFDTDQLVGQLKETPASRRFFRTISAAISYPALVSGNPGVTLPAAFVVPGGVEAGEYPAQTSYYQNIQALFQVVVLLDNKADQRGQEAANQVRLARRALWRALVNWNPDNQVAAYPIHLVSDQFLDSNQSTTYWEFSFAQAQVVTQDYQSETDETDEGLYQYPMEDLEEIQIHDTKHDIRGKVKLDQD